MSQLFSKLKLCEVEFRNRIWVSPMCQYSCQDGIVNDWHFVHLGSRAVGGAGLVLVEATAVSPEGRISPEDSGIWSDAHTRAFSPIAKFIREHGAVPGIQLAHAGRKASTEAPWNGGSAIVGARSWQSLAPSALAFRPEWPAPKAMDREDMKQVLDQFKKATLRSHEAGFELVEIHMAHGYLLHEFLSPLSNLRTDEYGGTLANRMRFPLSVAEAVRSVWPQSLPLLVRISASDWVEKGWDLDQSIIFARELKKLGVNLIDCSSGALVPDAKIPVAPLFQVPFAEAIRSQAQIPTAAVGLISEAQQAEDILREQKADAVFLARAFLRDPYWPLHAAKALGHTFDWPRQYSRAN